MTVTEAPRDVDEPTAAPTSPSEQPTGLAAVVGSGDPRNVGKLFVGTSLLFLLVAAVVGVLIGFERVDLDSFDLLASASVSQVVTFHAVVALFLVALPLLIGIATAVVPLQVGASTIAFPRASVAAYWVYLVSGALIVAAYALDGGPFGGDFEAVALFIAAFVVLLAALALAVISVVTTVLALRAPGMSLRRTPLFSWSMLVAGTVWLLVLPVLAAVMMLAYLDLQYGEQFLGGADGLYDRMAWVFWQPTLYAFAIPALGIIGSVVPVFAQRRHQRHRAAMFLIGLFGAMAAGGWAQYGFDVRGGTVGAEWMRELPWYAVSVVAVIPVLGLLGLWSGTVRTGRPRLASPLLLSFVAGLAIFLGVAAGIPTIIGDLELAGTTWMTAQATLVLAGTLLAAAAGLAFWAPKLYGKLLPEAPLVLAALVGTLGALVAAVPDAISGALDQPRFIAFITGGSSGLDEQSTIETLNLVSAVGQALLLLAALLVVVAVLRPRRRDEAVADDPWGGHTLEWATSSPPPIGHFAEIPPITSEAPLYDARYAPTEAST